MFNITPKLFYAPFIAATLLITSMCYAQEDNAFAAPEPQVYKINIKKEIGPAIWRQVSQAFEEAIGKKAAYIILHMNTYGGTAIHADSIRTLILNSKIPVFVFIDNNAASAGALIAIACDSIYMRPGANIGAATVVGATGVVVLQWLL